MSQLEAVERLEKRLETADLNVMLHKSEIQHTMHLKTENVKMRYEVLCVFLCSAKCMMSACYCQVTCGSVRACACVCVCVRLSMA